MPVPEAALAQAEGELDALLKRRCSPLAVLWFPSSFLQMARAGGLPKRGAGCRKARLGDSPGEHEDQRTLPCSSEMPVFR